MPAAKHDVFQAIADPTRREVLKILSKEEMPISRITSYFPVSRTAIVKHLQILSDAKLVSARKQGREKIYALHAEPLNDVKEWLGYYEQFWHNKLAILKHLVEHEEDNK
ncbi:DNA-binding transcriptional regulator, ArsR family [Mesobacillus persicus]|uniref:DNA-binding transcriptional regulator, ArsR family n=1 Tax=Mesobacillus persicus TaxID=930146 RepID=A0A1H7VTD6_9BACI|nr:metalloregulator ArsR/SmtB family transcription factor [Mesobacillus persicus]SEM12085.1 DNA-binding transcriptional regulator, ArsR family [Mesobacillus persicus]